LSSKIFLAALLARIRRTGIGEALLGDVLDEARNLAVMAEMSVIHEVLLLENKENENGLTPRKSIVRGGKTRVIAARVQGMEMAAMSLAEGGVIGVESRKGERARRVRLGVNDEEVRLALKDDDEVKGMGLGS
jgi:origin recognition complex subunit 1